MYSKLLVFTFLIFLSFVTEVEAVSELVTCDGVNLPNDPNNNVQCDVCKFVLLVNAVVGWLTAILIVCATILLAITGVQIAASAGSTDAKQILKDRLTNIIIGFVLIIGAFTLVDVLMKALVTDGQLRNSWNTPIETLCGAQEIPVNDETSPEPAGAVNVPQSFTPGGPTGTGLPAADARAALEAGGIADGGRVISYNGLQQVAIDGVIQMQQECNCGITVTEATGGTHAAGTYSHANGYKLDIRTRDNPAVVSYVKNNFQYDGTWPTGEKVYQRVTPTGLQKCAFHTTHMDCQFIPGQ